MTTWWRWGWWSGINIPSNLLWWYRMTPLQIPLKLLSEDLPWNQLWSNLVGHGVLTNGTSLTIWYHHTPKKQLPHSPAGVLLHNLIFLRGGCQVPHRGYTTGKHPPRNATISVYKFLDFMVMVVTKEISPKLQAKLTRINHSLHFLAAGEI